MNVNKLMVILIASAGIVLTSCEKFPLQRSTEYETSFYKNDLDMSVMDFILARQDIFLNLNEALAYVDEDPAYSDIKQLYNSQGNTFFLPSDVAMAAFFAANPIPNPAGGTPTTVPAFSVRDIAKDKVAAMLRYHVVFGERGFNGGLTVVKTWYPTAAYNAQTNPTGVMNLYMNKNRDGRLYINNYTGAPVADVRPRTPNLIATNGVVHVMDNLLTPPTQTAIDNN
jgi:uncharacterized surface protein with fasciclin (FAS1) repeats